MADSKNKRNQVSFSVSVSVINTKVTNMSPKTSKVTGKESEKNGDNMVRVVLRDFLGHFH